MIGQTWKMALKAVFANKMRTFLTMLGIIIGVASLITLVSIADGATSSVSDTIATIDSNYLTLQITDDKENPLRIGELYAMFENDEIEAVAPISRTSATVESGYTSGSMTLYGTTGAYFDIMDMEMAVGRTLKNVDIDNNSYVIVITNETAIEMFGYANAEGETISVDGISFKVAGVLAAEETTQNTTVVSADEESTETVTLEGYIPYTTLARVGDVSLDITQIYISATDTETMEKAESAVEIIMLDRLNNDEDAFSIVNRSEVMEAMNEVKNTMSLMLGGIAAISLLVGGIGIMNIMLVSVTERTKEIGIRKAIGAKRGSIMVQFLLEAVIVSLSGCFIGIGFSWVALKITGRFMAGSLTFNMNSQVVLIAVLFSAAIGIVFGLYPANKAAKKKPIEALRYTG